MNLVEDASISGTKENGFAPPPGAPPMASGNDVNRIYGNMVPPACDLRDNYAKIDLEKYIRPFTGKGSDVKKRFKKDLDKSCADWFEGQLNDFADEVISLHWSKKASDKPGIGFKKSFCRAARAGVLYRCGFQPKTPEQLEAERLQWEKERLTREKEEERERMERKKQAAKNRKLIDLIAKQPVKEYLQLTGMISSDDSKPELGKVGTWLKEIVKEQGTLSQDQLIWLCKQEARKIRQTRRQREKLKLIGRTMSMNDQFYSYLIEKGLVDPAEEPLLLSTDDFLPAVKHLEAIQEENQIDGFGNVIDFVTDKDNEKYR